MDDALKELIAIGASVTAHCQPCVTYHVEKARSLGVGEAEIQEAVRVGQMVERGAGSAMRDFIQDLVGKPGETGCCHGKGRLEAPAGVARCHCG
jgi:AhpD family alkylhydroperoxidase